MKKYAKLCKVCKKLFRTAVKISKPYCSDTCYKNSREYKSITKKNEKSR